MGAVTEHDCCPLCGRPLEILGGLPLCRCCNDTRGEYYNHLTRSIDDFARQADKVLIECPGATLYFPDSNDIAAGVRFLNDHDPSQGYEIIREPVYGPAHVRRRWVRREDAHLIRRCQSCQDYSVRMRRKEGPDLYLPSRKRSNPSSNRRATHKLPEPADQMVRRTPSPF